MHQAAVSKNKLRLKRGTPKRMTVKKSPSPRQGVGTGRQEKLRDSLNSKLHPDTRHVARLASLAYAGRALIPRSGGFFPRGDGQTRRVTGFACLAFGLAPMMRCSRWDFGRWFPSSVSDGHARRGYILW